MERLRRTIRPMYAFRLVLTAALAAAALAVTLSTLFLEPLVRVIASPQAAGATLRAFGTLWKDLPSIMGARSARS